MEKRWKVKEVEVKGENLLVSEYYEDLPFNYSAGYYASKFFNELRDNKKILGLKCSKCGYVYIPPRPVCGPCWAPLKEWVEVGNKGTLMGYTVVQFSFTHPNTGKARPVPFTFGFIKLDGVDSRLQHYINETDPKKLESGMRVQAVFKEERQGNLEDILYFEPI